MISGIIAISCGMVLIAIAVLGKARKWWAEDFLFMGGAIGALFVLFGFLSASCHEAEETKARLHTVEKESK